MKNWQSSTIDSDEDDFETYSRADLNQFFRQYPWYKWPHDVTIISSWSSKLSEQITQPMDASDWLDMVKIGMIRKKQMIIQ